MSKPDPSGEGEGAEGRAEPVLPWAANGAAEPALSRSAGAEGGDNVDEDMVVDGLEGALAAACPLGAVGLELNDKIEVKWELENEDGSVVPRWWGARILRPETGTSPESTGKIWVVMYDPFGSFSDEEAKIIFLSKRQIFDLSEGMEMRWRKEGELLGDTEFDDEGPEMKTLADIIEEGEMAGLNEETCAELEQEAMQKLPIANQQALAAGFQEFKDSFVGFLKRKEQQLGQNAVIGEEDVADFVKEMAQKTKRK